MSPEKSSVSQPSDAPQDETLACSVSDGFQQWLSQLNGSLIATTYQSGKVLVIGWDGRQVTFLPRQFDRPMGMAVRGKQLVLATRQEVLLFADAPLLASDYVPDQPGRYDALYLPRASYFTGSLNHHDVAHVGNDIWVVNTRFDCLATLSQDYSFVPRWKPPFISENTPEDRCHLNGLALVNGKPKYATAFAETDVPEGWREKRGTSSGVVMDIESNEIMLRGLVMPHSPRWHNNHLWLLNSGTGELWKVDLQNRRGDVVCALPGYVRGLCLLGPFALIGMGKIREKHIFGELPVQKRFDKLLCGIAVVDLRNGQTIGVLEFTSGCQELYDIQFLPGVRRPMILNRDKEAVKHAFTAPEFSYWLRPKAGTEQAAGEERK